MRAEWAEAAHRCADAARRTRVHLQIGLSYEWTDAIKQANAAAHAVRVMVFWWGARGSNWADSQEIDLACNRAATSWEEVVRLMTAAPEEGWRTEVAAALAAAAAANFTAQGAAATESGEVAAAWEVACASWAVTADLLAEAGKKATEDQMMSVVEVANRKKNLEFLDALGVRQTWWEGERSYEDDAEERERWAWKKRIERERATVSARAREMEMEWKRDGLRKNEGTTKEIQNPDGDEGDEAASALVTRIRLEPVNFPSTFLLGFCVGSALSLMVLRLPSLIRSWR